MTTLLLIICLQYFSISENPIKVRLLNTELPSGYNITDPHPNAFSPSTSYKLDIPDSAIVKINIYINSVGVVDCKTTLSPGTYSAQWDLNDSNGNIVESGVYLVKFTINSTVRDTKLIHSHDLIIVR